MNPTSLYVSICKDLETLNSQIFRNDEGQPLDQYSNKNERLYAFISCHPVTCVHDQCPLEPPPLFAF